MKKIDVEEFCEAVNLHPDAKKANVVIEQIHEALGGIANLYLEKFIESGYLFSWDDVPGEDNIKLKNFLARRFGIDWVETARIEKIDDGKTIRIYFEQNFLTLKLDDKKTKIDIGINDPRTYEFIVSYKFNLKIENDKLNVFDTGENQNQIRTIHAFESKLVPLQKIYGEIGRGSGVDIYRSGLIFKAMEEHLRNYFKKEKELFDWDDIPGKDYIRLIEFLTERFEIEWVKRAKVEKIDGHMTIRLTEEQNVLTLRLNDKKTGVNIEINNHRPYNLIVKIEKGRLKIYEMFDQEARCLFPPLGIMKMIDWEESSYIINYNNPSAKMEKMGEPRPIATLVHISDLHFGNNFSTDETILKKFIAILPVVRYYRGLYTHSFKAVRAMENKVNQILKQRKDEKIPSCVVVTGDLTSSGEKYQFEIVNTFLRNAISVNADTEVGLKLGHKLKKIVNNSEPALFVIPGNHDAWMSNQMGHSLYHEHIPGVFPMKLEMKANNRTVILWGIDSTLKPVQNRLDSRGRVNIDELKEYTQSVEKTNINIFCLHHPLADPPDEALETNMKKFAEILDKYPFFIRIIDRIHRIFEKIKIVKLMDKYGILDSYAELIAKTMILDQRDKIAVNLKNACADLVLAGHTHKSYIFHNDDKLPNHAIAGSTTRQCSEDRNFFRIDIYETKISLNVLNYINNVGFVADENEHIFALRIPKPTGHPDIETIIQSLKKREWQEP